MKLETIMRKIQEADLDLAYIEVLDEYAFAIDISDAIARQGKYSKMYYIRCEKEGMEYEEAKEKLGEFLRGNLGYVKKDESA